MSTVAATNLKNASSATNNIVLNADGTTTITSPTDVIKTGTAVATTSGTAVDFTGIPSWAKRITLMLNGVSVNGTAVMLVRLGYSGGTFTTSGYTGSSFCTRSLTTTTVAVNSTGFSIEADEIDATVLYGSVTLATYGSNVWTESHLIGVSGNTPNASGGGAGTVTLSGTPDRIRLTTVAGTATFDAGTINILYEG